jgi:oxygen-independent coproporphyrinogen-3 oxidase
MDDLGDMASDGLIALTDEGLQILSPGHRLIRNIAMVFDEHLRKKSGEVKFSRLI